MACLRSAEPVREFVSAVTSTEAAAGIYTLIRNSVQRDIYLDYILTSAEVSALALLWLAQPTGFASRIHAIKITKNNETHLRTHFRLKRNATQSFVQSIAIVCTMQRWAFHKIVCKFRKLRNCASCVALYAFFFSACAICVCESVNLIFVTL